MDEETELTKPTVKQATARIKAITQKIAIAEEKLEEAISKEIDSVEKGAKKVDQAMSTFGQKHGVLAGVLVTLAMVLVLWLIAEYYHVK